MKGMRVKRLPPKEFREGLNDILMVLNTACLTDRMHAPYAIAHINTAEGERAGENIA